MTPNEETSYPFYIKAPLILLGLVLTTYILSVLDDIFIPVAFAVLIAILLNPLYVRMEKKISKVPAILLSILVAVLLLLGLFYFLSTQIAGFVDKVPLIQKKMGMLIANADVWKAFESAFQAEGLIGTLELPVLVADKSSEDFAILGAVRPLFNLGLETFIRS